MSVYVGCNDTIALNYSQGFLCAFAAYHIGRSAQLKTVDILHHPRLVHSTKSLISQRPGSFHDREYDLQCAFIGDPIV